MPPAAAPAPRGSWQAARRSVRGSAVRRRPDGSSRSGGRCRPAGTGRLQRYQVHAWTTQAATCRYRPEAPPEAWRPSERASEVQASIWPRLLRTGITRCATKSASTSAGDPCSTKIFTLRRDVGPQRYRFVKVSNEEVRASVGGEGRSHATGAKPIGIGLDHGGAGGPAQLFPQQPVIGANRIKIDGQQRSGAGLAGIQHEPLQFPCS